MRSYIRQGQNCEAIQLRQQKYISLTICLFIALPTVIHFFNICFNFIFSQFIWDTIVIYGIVMIFSVISIFFVLQNLRTDNVILGYLFSIVYLFSFIFFTDNRIHMFTLFSDLLRNPFYILFLFSMPLYFYMRAIINYQLLFSFLSITAKITVIGGLIIFYLSITKGGFEIQYMQFSYNLLFGTCFCFYDYFKERKLSSLLFAIFGAMIIFIAGARGPVVCIGSYILLYIIFNSIKYKARTLSIAAFFVVILTYISSNFYTIAVNLNVYLMGLGLHSRTIEKILQNTALDLSGRDVIQVKLIKYILENPFLGQGMFGDRVITQQLLGRSSYAHNFFIEVLTQYGSILGLIVICAVLFIILRGLLMQQDPLHKNLILLFIPSGLTKLMISGSYLQEMYFFLLLGAAVNAIMHMKENQIRLD